MDRNLVSSVIILLKFSSPESQKIGFLGGVSVRYLGNAEEGNTNLKKNCYFIGKILHRMSPFIGW